ncbi:hypothetical protein [Actinobaculum massiliense]|uniref:hypothetical protein n=1 Tax=Actinobaculum massiliense TaxID=202789 RepID=UPI00254B92CF|nr:hypothetical protein [Actinobaculum massiliense]MDK8567765.1 hypothetical protein [Actinobaculum massiliense]
MQDVAEETNPPATSGDRAKGLEEPRVEVETPPRADRWHRWRSDLLSPDGILSLILWLFVLIFLAVTVLPGLGGNKVFAPTQYLNTAAPWQSDYQDAYPPNPGQWDVFDSVIPESIFITESTKDGHYPQWNTHQVGGTEGGTIPNTGLFSPLSIGWWIAPAGTAVALVKVFETIAVALGFYLLLRRSWGFAYFTVPLATLIYMGSSFMLSWTGWPQTRVAAMIPLLLWAADALVYRRKWSTSLWFGVIVASLLLGGFPAVSAYALYLCGGYFLLRWILDWENLRESLLSIARGALGLILGLGLSAIQMLPFVQFSLDYVDFEFRAQGANAMDQSLLATVFNPFYFGLTFDYERWPVHWIEGFSYVGVAVCVLAALGLVFSRTLRRGSSSYFGIVALVLLIGIYGADAVSLFLAKMPLVGTSHLGRLRVIIDMCLVVLAVIGAQSLFGGRARWTEAWGRLRTNHWIQIRTPLALAVCAFALSRVIKGRAEAEEALYPHDPTLVLQDYLWMGWVIGGGVVVICLAVVSLMSENRWAGVPVIVACGALIAGPTTTIARVWWPLSDADSFYRETPTHDYLAANLEGNRFIGIENTMMTGTQDAYGLRAATGHKFTDPRYAEVLSLIDPAIFISKTYTSFHNDQFAHLEEHGAANRLSISHVVASQGQLSARIQPVSVADFYSTAVLESEGNSIQTAVHEGPVDALQIRMVGTDGLEDAPGVLHIRLVSTEGEILAESQVKAEGINEYYIVPVNGADIAPNASWSAEISLEGSSGTITVGLDEDGLGLARPILFSEEIGMRLVHYDGTFTFERDGALPRIRWANESVVVADSGERLAVMDSTETPGNAVVLEREQDAREVDAGSHADLVIDEPNSDDTHIRLSANGSGWLVIGENTRTDGWSATLDGQKTELVPAEHFGSAIFVPDAGEHVVDLTYRNPHFELGKKISLASLIVALALGAGTFVSYRKGAR